MAVPHKILLAISIAAAWLSGRFAPEDSFLATSFWKTAFLTQSVLTLAYLTWSVIIYPKLFSPLRRLPQPADGSFINGQFWRILKDPTGEPHRDWMKTVPNDGLIYYTSFLNAPRVLVTSPDALREVLSQKSYEFIKPGMIIQGIGRILGIGVLVAEGDEHRRQRKNLMPAFQYRHIKDLYPVFWDKTRELVLALDAHLASRTAADPKTPVSIEVGKWASRSTLDIIGVAGMGKSFDAIKNENNELYQIYQKVFEPSKAARVMGMLTLFLPFGLVAKLPNKRNNDINGASEAIKQICRTMIREKKDKLAKGQSSGVDILSVAIESGGFSDEDLVNQMMTFLAAGHETTASALTWALVYLSQHPTIQTRLRHAINASSLPSIRSPTSTPTAEDLDNIPYLHAVCAEVLRFQPPSPSRCARTPPPPQS